MRTKCSGTLALALALTLSVLADLGFASDFATGLESKDHSHHNMQVSVEGAVMNENTTVLPRGCSEISRDHSFTVRAGSRFAAQPGMIFGMDKHELAVAPCSRVRINFINEDEVRHQWMVHGLPKYLYPAGMFHIEATGGSSQIGSFIVPGDARTYLIHCDIAQHMEMGMRGQLVVGRGSGDLWGVAGVSVDYKRAAYWPEAINRWGLLAFAMGLLFVFVIYKRSFRS
jgi:plastocyanin